MKIKTIISPILFTAILVVLALCRPVPVFAVSTVTVSSVGDGVFMIQGVDIRGASALEINVRYDYGFLETVSMETRAIVSLDE